MTTITHIQANFTGTYLKSDITKISSFYGLPEDTTDDEKMEFILEQCRAQLARFLLAPTLMALDEAKQAQVELYSDMVESAITSDYVEVEIDEDDSYGS